MKTLYDIYESILDDQEDILTVVDKAADRAMVDVLREQLIGSKDNYPPGQYIFEYDKKKRRIKTDKTIKINAINNVLYVESWVVSKVLRTPWSEIRKFVDLFDANFKINQNALKYGLKLSDLNIVNKRCVIDFIQVENRRYVCDSNLILNFFDTTPGPRWCIEVYDGFELHHSSLASSIGCIITYCSNIKNTEEAINIIGSIKNSKDKVMFLSGCSHWLKDDNLSYVQRKSIRDVRSIEDLFDHKKTDFGPLVQDAYERIKNLIRNNPGCKILLSMASSDTECSHVWLEGDQLKHEKIRSQWPWLKVK